MDAAVFDASLPRPANDFPDAPRRRTLRAPVRCDGVGLHSGARITMTLLPAEGGSGVVFVRTDLGGVEIPARWDHVVDTTLCTVIGVSAEATVATIEHLMAALAANGIDDCRIEIDGPEVPAMDGSSAPFLFLIDCAGAAETNAPRLAITLIDTITVGDADRGATLRPGGTDGLAIDFAIDFEAAAIGAQRFRGGVEGDGFRRELSRARTFGRLEDVEKMRAAGFGRGGSLDNAVIVDGDRVLNPGGLRYSDEFVRHKALDAVGDLSLAGAPFKAAYIGVKAGHALNNQVLRALFARPEAWRWTPAAPRAGAVSPASVGAGMAPRRAAALPA